LNTLWSRVEVAVEVMLLAVAVQVGSVLAQVYL
jgi:hypothetical protein